MHSFFAGGSREFSPIRRMDSDVTLPQIAPDDFARRFSLRARSLMWFLGAGASASAGIPTAGDMLWEFKQLLYVSQRKVSRQAVADLSSPTVRSRLQAHIDSSGTLPAAGTPDEYAALFETVYPAEIDRRSYLDAKIAGARPSYGHLALAALMRAQHVRLVWTTNFDPLVADACAKVYGSTAHLTTATLDAPDLAAQCVDHERWPVEVKLHGDFRSRRLKNTGDELRHQDEKLRKTLIECCRRFGMVVAGYSGRDSSVMDALEGALALAGVFPSGLFWWIRDGDPPLPRVERLLLRAHGAGIEAGFVRVQNFDETMRDLVRMAENVEPAPLDSFASDRRHWSPAPTPSGRQGWPVVRLNALPLVHTPNSCRRVVCGVGGQAEARAAVDAAGVDLIVARTRAGVLAFGTDGDVRAAFARHHISQFDLHTIETARLRYDSGERGLLREALSRALGRERGLDVTRRRSEDLLAPADPSGNDWAALRTVIGQLSGNVAHEDGLSWREGVAVRLDWADDRLWLLVEPRTVFYGITQVNRHVASDFARERTIKRYNRQLNELVSFWSDRLAGGGEDLRALGIGDGIDAVFRLSCDTAYSWRLGA